MKGQAQLADHVIDLLSGWGSVRAKRMFGGIGLFHESRMFGLIFDQTLYFRVDASAAQAEHARAFGYRRGDRWIRLPYLPVDAESLEHADALASLAGAAWLAAGNQQPTRRGASP